MNNYVAETNRWLKIQYTTNGKPFFYHKGRRIPMGMVVRTHHNPWISETAFPEYIDGYFAEDVFNPLFIQINKSGVAVKVFVFVKEEA